MTTECNDPRHKDITTFVMAGDRLSDMFSSSTELQQIMGNDWRGMSPDRLASYRVEMAFALAAEVHEAIDETGWKSWASSRHTNVDEFKDEMTDAWLFMLNLMISAGMTADDLFDRYIKKRVNAETRHTDGYDGVTTKCPTCKRDYDNEAVKCTPMHAGPEGAGAAYCAYKATGKDDKCPVCGNLYEVRVGCHGWAKAGYGWCHVNKQSFDARGVVTP